MLTKSLLIKSAIGVGAIGGLGFVGYQAINSQLSKKEENKILKQLTEEGYTALTKESQYFEEILGSYKKATKLKFDNFTGSEADTDAKKPKDILWEHCENTFSAEANDDLLSKARKWCVEPITVSAMLNEKKLPKFNKDSSDNGVKDAWDKKIEKYRKLSSAKQIFSELNLDTDGKPITDEHRDNLNKKCEGTGDTKNHNDKYEDNLQIFETWCTSKK